MPGKSFYIVHMFIQTEATPNPATLKFLPGQPVLRQGTAEFRSEDAASASPLALRLFGLPGVAAIFLSGDFISVTKTESTDWAALKTPVLAEIMQHFTSGAPVMSESAATEDYGDEGEIVRQIREILDTRVRPAVAQDGGDITFVRFEDGIVHLKMQGACAGCPSSTATLKMGVENLLKHYVPEVIAVVPVSDDF